MEAGIELSLYVMLGIGGRVRSASHARETVKVLNEISPDFIRLRTFVPKINTPLLKEVEAGSFHMLGPHGVLLETRTLVTDLQVASWLASDHYTNYIHIEGRLPDDKCRMLQTINNALKREENAFRPFFVGTE